MQSYSELPPGAAEIFAIWPETSLPPGSENATWHEQSMQPPNSPPQTEMVRNVVIPTLTMFKPEAGTANGTSLVIAPGGAFHFLMVNHEGYDVARWLTTFGVTAFVLKYRVHHMPEDDADMPAFLEELDGVLAHPDQMEINPPVGHPSLEEARLWGEEDGRQAIRYLRQNAAKLDIDATRIGIMGFSAGGGVTVNAALEYDALSRPDFAAGIYPAYRIVEPIPTDAPPLFIVIADDDTVVAPMSSARLYEAWHKVGVSVELHAFANGGHGFGMNKQNKLSDIWIDLFKNWLVAQGFI